MEVKFKVPQKWVEMAEEINIPKNRMKEFFEYYLDCMLNTGDPYEQHVADFQYWLEGSDCEGWIDQHLSETGLDREFMADIREAQSDNHDIEYALTEVARKYSSRRESLSERPRKIVEEYLNRDVSF